MLEYFTRSRSRAEALMNTHFPSALKCKQNLSPTKTERMADLRLASPDTPRDSPGGTDQLRPCLLCSADRGCATLSFLMAGGEGKAQETNQTATTRAIFYIRCPIVMSNTLTHVLL